MAESSMESDYDRYLYACLAFLSLVIVVVVVNGTLQNIGSSYKGELVSGGQCMISVSEPRGGSQQRQFPRHVQHLCVLDVQVAHPRSADEHLGKLPG